MLRWILARCSGVVWNFREGLSCLVLVLCHEDVCVSGGIAVPFLTSISFTPQPLYIKGNRPLLPTGPKVTYRHSIN
jgi:hypothetical protein